jgi:hypothetical protein
LSFIELPLRFGVRLASRGISRIGSSAALKAISRKAQTSLAKARPSSLARIILKTRGR